MPSILDVIPPKIDIPGGEVLIFAPSVLDPASESPVWVRCTRHPFTKRPPAWRVNVSAFDDIKDIKDKAALALADCPECAFERERETPKRTTLWGEGAEW